MITEVELRALVENQAATIAALQAELTTLRAAAPSTPSGNATSSSTPISGGSATPKRVSEKKYLGVTSYFPWNEERLLRLLTAVVEVISAATPDNAGLDAVMATYLRLSGSDTKFTHQLTLLEVEYALGKIYHDGFRIHNRGIGTIAIYDYLRDHPEVSQFFSEYLGSPPYYGPN